jgi:hypothetical protein
VPLDTAQREEVDGAACATQCRQEVFVLMSTGEQVAVPARFVIGRRASRVGESTRVAQEVRSPLFLFSLEIHCTTHGLLRSPWSAHLAEA